MDSQNGLMESIIGGVWSQSGGIGKPRTPGKYHVGGSVLRRRGLWDLNLRSHLAASPNYEVLEHPSPLAGASGGKACPVRNDTLMVQGNLGGPLQNTQRF